MIDFGPLLSNPKMFLFGAAAQFGIFFTIVVAAFLGFDIRDAASIGIIGAADGPTSPHDRVRLRQPCSITVAAALWPVA